MLLEVTTLDMEVDSVQDFLVLLVEVSTEVDLEDSTLLLNVIEVSLLTSVHALLDCSYKLKEFDRSIHG